MSEQDDTSVVIKSIYIGKNAREVVKDIAAWLTDCLEKKITPEQFQEIWERFEEKWEPSNEVPGVTEVEGEKDHWGDHLVREDEIDTFYREAFNAGASKFITFNTYTYSDIVAIRGHPSGRDIAILVLGEGNAGDWTDKDTEDYIGKDYLTK